MPPILPQDRLVRKEVSLGAIRELPPPTNHIGLAQIAPFKEVQSDDVIFSYIAPDVDGLAPARAEDAESEMADKDDMVGYGRASIIDWALKDHYDPSDVSRYREYLRLAQLASVGAPFPLTITSMTEDWQSKLARDLKLRRRKLDNRIEWLIMTALDTGVIAYNDGKIKFTVDYGRPAGQDQQAPAGGLWSTYGTSDPIGDFITLDRYMYDTYYVHMGTAIASRFVWQQMARSMKFTGLAGFAGFPGGTPVDPNYLIEGWGPLKARQIFEAHTGCKTIEYDSVYRTRALGSKTTVNNRFTRSDTVIFLPETSYIDEISDGEIGFANTLTSPHPEGNWTPGFYEWEKTDVDPWGHDVGAGVKAFPVFPHMQLTYTLKVM